MSQAEHTAERRGLLPRFTLKDADTFVLGDALGDIHGVDDGLFFHDTRLLSRFELLIAGRQASLLGAAINQDNTLFTAHLTNRPLPMPGERSLPQGVIHIERCRLLWDGQMYERLRLTNFSDEDAEVPLRFSYAADFVDIFEVQGHVRPRRGEILPPTCNGRSACLSYRGLDERTRAVNIGFSEAPISLTAEEAQFLIPLRAGAKTEMYLEVGALSAVPSAARYENAAARLRHSMRGRLSHGATVSTSGRLFDQWLEKSRSDLALLTTALPTGPYPYAGIPWFATQFGRDAIITALQVLWLNPELAAGVLRFLAATQSGETSSFRDSEPGKIMHETRRGEMAALGEVPFGRYYGGVDTTPLFVMLAGAYEARTGDGALIDEIWPALRGAIAWIERRLDESPTGFLDYARGQKSGLVNQAWKDSQDSMFHADGQFPAPPIAVVEVQGYAYAAFKAMASLAVTRTDPEKRAEWLHRSAQLRLAIEQRFWVPEMDFYAIALDGEGEPCKVYGSNAGHLLFCGVPSEERAHAVANHLMSERFCSGWGIRTLAMQQPRFNPMSYHNGSIWPHDTSICAAGMSRYGRRRDAVKVLSDVFETAVHFSMRLPELYCGFPRVAGQDPAPYPVACLPQAWASASVFLLLQAALGVEVNGQTREIAIERPMLPIGIELLTVNSLPVGSTLVNLEFRRVGESVVVTTPTLDESDLRVRMRL